MKRFEPGERAYRARFEHLPGRHAESWASQGADVKAIWARVEAALQPASALSAADQPSGDVLAAFNNAYAAAYRPGLHHAAQCAGLRAVICLLGSMTPAVRAEA